MSTFGVPVAAFTALCGLYAYTKYVRVDPDIKLNEARIAWENAYVKSTLFPTQR